MPETTTMPERADAKMRATESPATGGSYGNIYLDDKILVKKLILRPTCTTDRKASELPAK